MRTRLLAVLSSLLLWCPAHAGSPTINDRHLALLRGGQIEIVAQERPKAYFRFAQDGAALKDDKAAHFGIGFAAATLSAWVFDAHNAPRQLGVLGWQGVGWLAWEIKDGLVPWESAGAIGGDGFSVWDLAYSMAGAAMALLVY